MIGMFRFTIGVMLLSCSAISASAQDGLNQVLGADSPVMSPDNKWIAFSYQGDIWEMPVDGGIARRLTVHTAEDTLPQYSPDGQWFAFSSKRFGQDDVFIMPIHGGEPRRLTFHSKYDHVTGFSHNSRYVLFESYRDWQRYRTYRIPIQGGEPEAIMDLEGSDCAISPNGQIVAFKYNYVPKYRLGYHGACNSNIWLKNLTDGQLQQLTNYDGLDRDPIWSKDGKNIFFVSDRQSQGLNLFQIDANGQNVKQITHFDQGYLFSPSLSTDGQTFLFIHDFQICKCGLDGHPETIKAYTSMDFRTDLDAMQTFHSRCDEVAFAPTGKSAALVQRGELFASAMDGKKLNQLMESPYKQSNPVWSKDAKTLFFLSDHSGYPGIYKITSSDSLYSNLHSARYTKIETVYEGNELILGFRLSPDEKFIAFQADEDGLFLISTDGKNKKLLNPSKMIDHLSFSPDGNWLAFSMAYKDWNYDIFLLHLADLSLYNITETPGNDFLPEFSNDGKQLIFVSQYQESQDIYSVWLNKSAAEDYNLQTDLDEDTEPKSPLFKIDLDGIQKRVHRLITSTSDSKRTPVLSSDSQKCAFVTSILNKPYICIYNMKEDILKELVQTDATTIQWADDNQTIFYRTNSGNLNKIDVKTKSQVAINFSGSLRVDRRTEFLQMFREAWLILKYYFYSPDEKAVDWNRLYEKYHPLIETCRTDSEFQHCFSMMTGELNASHLGIHKNNDQFIEDTGYIGVRTGDFIEGKGIEVLDVVEGSPADRVQSKIFPGEYVNAIKRISLTPNTNISELLNGTVDKLIDLDIRSSDSKSKLRTIQIKPVKYDTYLELAYEDWVEHNRAMVSKMSGGKIGYIHIRAMSVSNLKKFEWDLFGRYRSNDAMIFDVRYNTGGNIHNELLAHLKRSPFGYIIPKGGGKAYQPDQVYRKPSALLIHERSFSDAEVFANGYQTLKIGPVIGMPTYGGVIATGRYKLMDGTSIRLPWIGWFTLDGRNMERTGVEPDIRIDRSPDEIISGKDSQLEKAVETVMNLLKEKDFFNK